MLATVLDAVVTGVFLVLAAIVTGFFGLMARHTKRGADDLREIRSDITGLAHAFGRHLSEHARLERLERNERMRR